MSHQNPPKDINERGPYSLYQGQSFQSRFFKNKNFLDKEFIVLCSVSTCKAPFKNFHELKEHEETCKKAREELRQKSLKKCVEVYKNYGCLATWMTNEYDCQIPLFSIYRIHRLFNRGRIVSQLSSFRNIPDFATLLFLNIRFPDFATFLTSQPVSSSRNFFPIRLMLKIPHFATKSCQMRITL